MEAPGPNKSVNREKEERRKKKIRWLVMPKYGGKHNFSYVSFPEVGQKQKT